MRLFRRSVRDPAWGLEIGDVLALDLLAEDVARVQIVNVQPPNKEYDYLRITARVIEPEVVDLSGGPGNDSVVPVGASAQPVEIDPMNMGRDLQAFFAATLPMGEGGSLVPRSTPGLVVLVPDDDGGSADDPVRAGFRLVQKGAEPVAADGNAILLEWPKLADRLRTTSLGA